MAFDEALAGRIRALLGDRATDEKKVFGGLAFMIGGNMAVAASSNGGIIVRVDPAEGPELAETTPAELMEMRGKTMHGWLRSAMLISRLQASTNNTRNSTDSSISTYNPWLPLVLSQFDCGFSAGGALV